MAYTVKAVADLAGISVRTLHHYDEIKLLKPASLTAAGYRLYTKEDLARLQQILFFRELGFGLEEIKEILGRPDFDRQAALQEHKRLLLERRERLDRLIQSVQRTLAAMERGIAMNEKDMFDGFDQSQYEEEARQRWGHTKEYQESARRTKGYTKADWDAIKQEMGDVTNGIAALMDRDPADAEVQEQVRRWHQLINDRFYACSPEIFRALGDGYVSDSRFTATYEKVKPGLAHFLRDAMHVYCDALEGK